MDNNQKQEEHQDDLNKKESTDHDETVTSSTPPAPVVYHSDVCSICQENVSMLDINTFIICTGCGKCMHTMCGHDLRESNLSLETRNSCPMCRAKNAPKGSKEEIRRLRKWSQKKKTMGSTYVG